MTRMTQSAATLLAFAILLVSSTPMTLQAITKMAQMQEEKILGMMSGRWEGEYIDIGGHRGKLLLDITESTAEVRGSFELSLDTEDMAERYQGTLFGDADGDDILLRLQFSAGALMLCRLTIKMPSSYAMQAAFGVAEPVPEMKLSGGVVLVWRFRQE